MVVTAAFMLLAQSNHFVTLFVSLETAAVGLYVLVGYLRRSQASLEAGVKYLVAGGLSSALLLMGIVLVYGSLGGPGVDSLNFDQINTALAAGKGTALTMVGLALILGGAAFKLGAFPFHAWIPDVYQGAPTPTTALLGTASKAAGAFTLLLLVTGPFAPLAPKLAPLLAIAAILTLLVGNLAALATTDVKRVLALSGVSHAGFLLAAIAAVVIAGTNDGPQLLSIYLIAYTIGTFLVSQALVELPVADDHHRPLLGLRGLLRRSPILASALGFGIGSLAGIPPSIGFFAKLLILISSLSSIFGGSLAPPSSASRSVSTTTSPSSAKPWCVRPMTRRKSCHWKSRSRRASSSGRCRPRRFSVASSRSATKPRLTAPRVMLTVGIAQGAAFDRRIDLRRGDVRMPEHLLDGTQVSAARQEVRRKGVP
ncbi:NADH-quinone oxidoreductase subunit N 1 [Verrucomicrobiota bacterium]|nr:NADH-quinone oxidoreductase subunit N 1 [Verrucomicrobiota bacterium]